VKRTSILKLVLAVAAISAGLGVGVSIATAHSTFCGAAGQPACPPSDRGVVPTNGSGNVQCPDGTTQVAFSQDDLDDGTETKPYTIAGTPPLSGNVTVTWDGQHVTFSVTGGAAVQRIHLHGGAGGGGENSTNQYNYAGFPAGGVAADGNLHFPGPRSGIFVCLVRPTQALAVTTSSLRATRYGKSVVLRWRTASEVDTLGFQVYRLVRGHRVKLSKRIIPAASLVNSRSSNGYSFRVRLSSRRIAATSRFVLAEVHNDGRRTWYGPVRAVAAT
jgi:hypothetical protein